MNRSIVVLIGMLNAIASQSSLAGIIGYSWEGTIEPLQADVDPWNIGEGGKPFSISAFVDQEAVDIDPEVGGASFLSVHSTLSIDGVPAEAIGEGRVSFRELGGRDTVSINLEDVILNGIRERFRTTAGMLTSTFTFHEIAESPPIFDTTTTPQRAASVDGLSGYRTILEAGATITVTPIPEPSALVLIVMALLGPTIFFWRNYTRRRVRKDSRY